VGQFVKCLMWCSKSSICLGKRQTAVGLLLLLLLLLSSPLGWIGMRRDSVQTCLHILFDFPELLP